MWDALLKAFLALTACLMLAQPVLSQEPSTPPPPAAEVAPEALSAPVSDGANFTSDATPDRVLSRGGDTLEKKLVSFSMTGARTLLYVLFVLSVVCVAVAIEKYLQYRRENPLGNGFRAELAAWLERGDVTSACKAVEKVRGVNAALVREALHNMTEGAAAVEEIIGSRLILERGRLEKRLIVLGTVGNNAPFIGLLGTVMGIIKAFHDLSTAAIQGPQAVMAGISEALIATAVGLFVAIPAVILFNTLKSRARALLDEAEANVKIVLAYAKRTQEASRGSP